MREFNITPPDENIREALQSKIDNLTKPKGSLGMLEELALKVGMIQQSLSPELRNPQHILFGADHGILEEGVSCTPKEVTWQQMGHFLQGGAGISFLCAQHGFKLNVVDSGVDFDFPAGCGSLYHYRRNGIFWRCQWMDDFFFHFADCNCTFCICRLWAKRKNFYQ